MSELDKYCLAVSQRKPRDKHGSVNVAILLQLQDNDVPALLEIIRIQQVALTQAVSECDQNEDLDDLLGTIQLAETKIEALSAAGSKAIWGDHRGDANGSSNGQS